MNAQQVLAVLVSQSQGAIVPEMVSDEGDTVEFAAQVTHDSGCVNNPCAYPTVDGEESDALSFRVQTVKEQLWERFCNEFASTYAV